MAFQRPFLISLKREDLSVPWGFRMTGGTTHQPQHVVQQVLESSQAENAGLHEGDEVIQVGRVNVQSLNQHQVQEVIGQSRNRIEMFIIREDLFRSRKENEPPVVKAVVHSNYNSPFQLYSTENVADTLALQTRVLTEGPPSPGLNQFGPQHSPPGVSRSDVLKYVKEEDEGGYVERRPIYTTSTPIAPPRKKPAPPPPSTIKPSVRFQEPPASTIDVTDYRNLSDAQYQQEQYHLQQRKYQSQSYQTSNPQHQEEPSYGCLNGQTNDDDWSEEKFLAQARPRPAQATSRVPLQSRENYAVSYNQQQRATTEQYQQPTPPARQESYQHSSYTSQQTIAVQKKVQQQQQQLFQQQQQYYQAQQEPNYLSEQERIKAREEQLRQQEYLQQQAGQQEEIRRHEQLRQQKIQQEQLRQQQWRQQREQEGRDREEQQLADQRRQQLEQTTQSGPRRIPPVRTRSSYEEHVGSMTKTGDRAAAPLTSTARITCDSPTLGSPNVTRRGGGIPVWPPKNSSVRELPRTGFSPNLAHEKGSKKFTWPPQNEDGEERSRPPTPSGGGGVANAWHPTESSGGRSLPFARSPTPTRRSHRGDQVWPPAHSLQRESPKHSPQVIRRKTGSFDDYVHQHASVNVPPTYRTPPGTQHVEIVYEDDDL